MRLCYLLLHVATVIQAFEKTSKDLTSTMRLCYSLLPYLPTPYSLLPTPLSPYSPISLLPTPYYMRRTKRLCYFLLPTSYFPISLLPTPYSLLPTSLPPYSPSPRHLSVSKFVRRDLFSGETRHLVDDCSVNLFKSEVMPSDTKI